MATNKIIAVQMDRLETINLATDTSFILALEAQNRGFKIFEYQPENLKAKSASIYAQGRFVELKDSAAGWFQEIEHAEINLSDAACVLMRQDPPFDMRYINATYMLEMLTGKTLILNNPAEVRNNPEKLIPFHFTEFMPRTILTRDLADIEAFQKTVGEIIIKPLHLFGGKGVFRLRNGENLASLVEFMNLTLAEPLVVQEFLPDVASSEKRIIMIDGKIAGAMQRKPADGEIRANTRVGGTPVKTELSERERTVCEKVGAFLKARELHLAGIDLIGGYLTEVNITSPTGIRLLNKLYGYNLERIFWDSLKN